MGDDTSDILGTHHVPIIRDSPSGRWSGLSFGVKSAFIFAVILAAYVTGRRLWESLLVWREKSYKLSMRRRHGIPDNDHRPFNVAYAAVMRARQENEATKRKAKLQEAALGQDHRNALPDQNLRLRQGSQRNTQAAWPNGAVGTQPGGLNPSQDDLFTSPGNANGVNYGNSGHPPVNPPNFTDRYNPVRMADVEFNHSPPRAGPSHRSSRKNLNISDDDEGRKRALDKEEFEESDHMKKSRVEGEELIDGDEDPEWEEDRQMPQRGSKRVLADEDEDVFLSKRTRDKRARKISRENAPLYQSDDMEIDDNEADDEVAELKSISRGKKRDRAEAGSTFGGDDEESVYEAEIEDDIKRRRRKRRTVGKRKSDAGSSSRGKKRDRDVEEGDSDVESVDGDLLKVSRKKRGKRSASTSLLDEEERRGGSDLSMDESQTSSSRGRGRRIGDQWESNGVMFKIGPNGQRLRQALIKKARQKFNMPIDSQHPDRDANLEVCVETWLTEEEFKEAKAQRLLAWQDTPKASTEPESPSAEVKDLPSSPAGKNLLWRSRSAAPSPLSQLPAQSTPPRQMDSYRHSIATNVGLRINPFQQNALSGKRIASGARVASVFSGHGVPSGSASPGLTDSTNSSLRNGYKTFSKWEKQDLEAKAMMKMREANMKKQAEKDREDREKAEKEKKEKELATAAAKPTPTPTITITTPAEIKAPQVEAKPPTLSFAPPRTSSEPAKDAANKQASLFGPPPGGSTPPFTLGNAPPPKSEDKPPAKPAPPQPSTSGFIPFTNSSSGLPAKPPAPLFSAGTTDGKQPQSVFSFPAVPKPANASAVENAVRPAFSLNPAPSQPSQAPSMEDGQYSPESSGGSLLSRLAPPAAQSVSQPQQPSVFSFNKPAGEAQKSSSVFGNTTVQAPSIPTAAAATTFTGATSKPKFDFGISNKPLSSPAASAAASAAPTSSLSGALGNDAAKPASTPLSFNFKAPAVPAGGTSTGTTTPKFSFAASSAPAANGTNPFGGSKVQSTATTPQSNDQTKPLTFGGTTSSTPTFGTNPFGGNKDSAVTSATSQPNEIQTQPSPFSATNSWSTSPFGTPGGNNSSTVSQFNASQNKPSPFSTTNPSSASSPFASFGGPQSNNAAANSAFTGFGTRTQGASLGTNSSGAGSSVFASGGNSGAAAKPADTPKAPFSWSTTPSSTPAAANSGEASKPTFSFDSQTVTPVSATPAANGASSPFAFKFGDTSKTSTTPTMPQTSQPPARQHLFSSNTAGTTPTAFGFGAPPASNGTSSTGGSSLFNNTFSTGQQQK